MEDVKKTVNYILKEQKIIFNAVQYKLKILVKILIINLNVLKILKFLKKVI